MLREGLLIFLMIYFIFNFREFRSLEEGIIL